MLASIEDAPHCRREFRLGREDLSPAGHSSTVSDRILEWYASHGRDLPWRRTRDPYRILVAEVMLQQTQVERVLPKYEQWLAAFPTIDVLAQAATAEVIRLWAPLGYNSRAVRLQAIARECMERFGSQMPTTFEHLRQLKGVGRYTAGAIACFGYEQQVTFWDTNVRRVLTRLLRGHGLELSEPDMEELAAEALPRGRAYEWHQALMDMGAAVCTSRAPRCDVCPVMDLCAAYPAVLLGPRIIAERKARYEAQPFESTNRYFRGRLVDALRERSPLPLASLSDLLGRDDPTWASRLVAGLERDGLLVRSGDQLSLP
jgi:A/G-specific adenine glycosylase